MNSLTTQEGYYITSFTVELEKFSVPQDSVALDTDEPYRYLKLSLIRKCVLAGKIYHPIDTKITINNIE